MNLNRFIKERLCYKGCSQTIYANFSTINIEFFKHYTDNIFFFRIMETHIASYMKNQIHLYICCQLLVFQNNSGMIWPIKLKTAMLYYMKNYFRHTVS